MFFPRFDYEAIIFCTSNDIDDVESVTNGEMTRDLNNYCAPNSPAKKARKAKKKAWSSWLSLLFHAFFASEKPGKDRKVRKFFALLKTLRRSSKKAWRAKI